MIFLATVALKSTILVFKRGDDGQTTRNALFGSLELFGIRQGHPLGTKWYPKTPALLLDEMLYQFNWYC